MPDDVIPEVLELDGLTILDSKGNERITFTIRDAPLGLGLLAEKDPMTAAIELRDGHNNVRATFCAGNKNTGAVLHGGKTAIAFINNHQDLGQAIWVFHETDGRITTTNGFTVNNKTEATRWNMDANLLMSDNLDQDSKGFGLLLHPNDDTTAYGY